MSHPEHSNGQQPESRMNWITLLVIMTLFSLVAYFIVSGLMNKMEEGRKLAAEEAAKTAQQEAPAQTETAAAPASDEPADGKEVYGRVCVACHQAEGTGVPGAFPPLAGSEFVTGDSERLVKIVLHGLSGPLTVKGEKYNSSMPPWGATLTDQEVAAVATYVRSSFGNSAAAVDAAAVQKVREATSGRSKPFTAEEL
jgi:mono/diheme cytochrome c family protein